jgi:predicted nuclease of restriction endonuclease-like (RecB) superfamily
VAQIPWGHNALILEKIKDAPTALWYVRKTIENGWSRNVLGIQIANRLYDRQAAAEKLDNFSGRLPAASSDLARETLKDPYVFDFLGLGEEAKERDIEDALVERLTRFMLELGKGFAFVGRQYHLEVGGGDFYIDLLFYHLKLHCYVAIELKTGPFKPEYAGKLNFYLTALDEEVKNQEDNPSIGAQPGLDQRARVTSRSPPRPHPPRHQRPAGRAARAPTAVAAVAGAEARRRRRLALVARLTPLPLAATVMEVMEFEANGSSILRCRPVLARWLPG